MHWSVYDIPLRMQFLELHFKILNDDKIGLFFNNDTVFVWYPILHHSVFLLPFITLFLHGYLLRLLAFTDLALGLFFFKINSEATNPWLTQPAIKVPISQGNSTE
jgi:hypothetical protein